MLGTFFKTWTSGGRFSRQPSMYGAHRTCGASICPRGGKKIEKVMQNGALWCILMHATSDKMSKMTRFVAFCCIALHEAYRRVAFEANRRDEHLQTGIN